MDTAQFAAPLVGLAIAFGGVGALVSPLGKVLGPPDRTATHLRGHAALWLLAASVLAIVVFWERRPLDSLWWRTPDWRTVALAVALAVTHVKVVFPFNLWLLKRSGLPGFQTGVERVLVLPLWLRIVAVVTAGVVEETLFHGFGLTRLGEILGNPWWGAAVVVPAFAFLHYPNWGPGPVLTFVVAGTVSAVVFVLTRDLAAMILAHVLVDGNGLIVAPLRSTWWKSADAGKPPDESAGPP